jgi:hypothetical protein
MDTPTSSQQVKRCLERLAGRELHSVFVVRADYFVVREHRARRRERLQNAGFLGVLPPPKLYDYEASAKLDRTVRTSFYLGVSSNEIVLMDTRNASTQLVRLPFAEIAEVVVLHRSTEPGESLFALCLYDLLVNDNTKANEADRQSKTFSCLFRCVRRRELLASLSIAMTSASMLSSLCLKSMPMRFSYGAHPDGVPSTGTRPDDSKIFLVAPPLNPPEERGEGEGEGEGGEKGDKKEEEEEEITAAATASKKTSQSKIHQRRHPDAVWPIFGSMSRRPSAVDIIPPKGYAVFCFSGYRFMTAEGFSQTTSSISGKSHPIGLFTQSQRLKKSHFTLEITKPVAIEYEAEAIEEIAWRMAKEIASSYLGSRIRLQPRQFEKRDRSDSDQSQWDCVEMHLQVLGSESSASEIDDGGGSGGGTACVGRDVIIMVARRRYLPPTRDMFHDVIIIFRAGSRRWHTTDSLLQYPRAVYNSLAPLSVYPLDGLQDLLQARADALLLPTAGFLYYRKTFHVQPGPCNRFASHFIFSLINFLERHDRIIVPSNESKERILKVLQGGDNLEIKMPTSTTSHVDENITRIPTTTATTTPVSAWADPKDHTQTRDPLFYALEMEKLAPGLGMESCHQLNIRSHYSELPTSSSRREWKRRCWYYLATLLDQVCAYGCFCVGRCFGRASSSPL